MHSTEGGCRVPLIVKTPKPAESTTPHLTGAFCTVMDIVPTILEYAGIKHPGSRYKGRKIAPLRECSWIDFLSKLQRSDKVVAGSETEIHDAEYIVGFEIAGSGALRKGDWKITFVPAPKGPQKWELFNIKNDPGETQDLADQHQLKTKEMLELWEEYKADVGSVGVAGEYPSFVQGDPSTTMADEFEDPYSWIKYIGRPEIMPESLRGRIPG